ncbi:TOBE domain-containing protein [Marichromatium purpuratum]|uniref:TOBE domain-containing protein n=1 Tax=Marichromatium purpuratum TaxID=37487 RepID=UPI0009FD96A2|nr:TOBE domain-containing protein [Marichromatium purpuratum]
MLDTILEAQLDQVGSRRKHVYPRPRRRHPPPEGRLLARITRHSWERLRHHPGQQVHAQVKAVAVMD